MPPCSSKSQYVLGIDTTSSTLRLGLSDFAEVNRSQSWAVGRDLSLYLHQHLAEFIKPYFWPDLTALVVAKGPGSYTSTRIGVVTARTLAQQLSLPLYGISTLAMFAQAYCIAHHCPPETQLVVEMPGQRGHVHGGLYQLQLDLIVTMTTADRHLTLAEWEEIVTQQQPHERLSLSDPNLSASTLSEALLALGRHQQGKNAAWEAVLPHYG